MPEKKAKKSFKILSSLTLLALLSACQTVKVQDTEVCAVAGRMKAGADCVHSLSDDTRSLNLNEFIDFLEPAPARKDPKTGKTTPAKGPALCMSSDDFNKNKTALEKACYALGNACTYDIKKAIEKASQTASSLIENSTNKASGKR